MLDDIRTERLLLRKVVEADRAAFTAMVSDREVVRMLARWPWPADPKIIDAFFHMVDTEPQRGFAITMEGAFLGSIGIGPKVGFMLARDGWGKGVMTEALLAVQALGLSLFGSLEGNVLTDNPASARVFEKCGWQYIGKGGCHCAARQGPMTDWHYRLEAA